MLFFKRPILWLKDFHGISLIEFPLMDFALDLLFKDSSIMDFRSWIFVARLHAYVHMFFVDAIGQCALAFLWTFLPMIELRVETCRNIFFDCVAFLLEQTKHNQEGRISSKLPFTVRISRTLLSIFYTREGFPQNCQVR